MPELHEYEVMDARGNAMTVQLTEDDAKKLGARKVGGRARVEDKPKPTPPKHDPVHNRARR